MSDMMQTMTRHLSFIGMMLLLLGLAACRPQETIIIYITPTPQPSATSASTLVPTTVAMLATETATGGAVAQAATATQTAAPTLATAEPGSFGPIIDASYSLPPTSTPPPTSTLPPSSTPTPINTPIATLYPAYPALDGNRIGVQMYYNLPIDAYYVFLQHAKWLNVGWIKLQADWSFLQPEGPGAYGPTFQFFVDYVQRTRAEGFRVLLSVVKAPDWARSTVEEDGPPDDPQLYVNFLAELMERIKPENIAAIEVWNEPNLIREWRGTLPFNGAGYMQLFRPAYDRIKSIAPEMQVISAGLAPTGNTAGSVDDRTYMQQMYDAGLAEYTLAAVGIHPYSWSNPPDFVCCDTIPGRGWDDDPHFFFADNLRDYRAIMERNGHNVPMWTTEFGWATWDGYPGDPPDEWMRFNTLADQVEYTVRALEIGQSLDYMGPMILWNLNFGTATLIQDRLEMSAYSLTYDVDGLSLSRRPLFEVLSQIVTRQ